jgi:hypothetical protein
MKQARRWPSNGGLLPVLVSAQRRLFRLRKPVTLELPQRGFPAALGGLAQQSLAAGGICCYAKAMQMTASEFGQRVRIAAFRRPRIQRECSRHIRGHALAMLQATAQPDSRIGVPRLGGATIPGNG